MVRHLAVFSPDLAKLIFSGKKKIDGRFSKIRIAPFGRVSSGDIVLIKTPGEAVVGQFLVDRVFSYDHPNGDEIDYIKRRYAKDLAVSDSFWLSHEKISYITLMFVKSVSKFLIAPEIPKKDLRSWVVLDD